MLPCPSALNTPVRASGVALMAPTAKTSPLVTKTYWPFKLAVLNFPTGGGGLTIPLPPQETLQSAAPATSIIKMRFIAHLAALPFVLASSPRRERVRSLSCCERRRPGRPSVPRGRRSRYYCHRGPGVHRRCARYRQDSTRDGWPGELWRCRDERRSGRKTSEPSNGRPWEAYWRPTRILRPCREENSRGSRYRSEVAAHPAASSLPGRSRKCKAPTRCQAQKRQPYFVW